MTIHKIRKKEKDANVSLRLQACFLRKNYFLHEIRDILDT